MSSYILLKSMKKWRKKVNVIIIEYVWLCLNVPKYTGFWICLKFLNAEILNTAKFWIKKVFQNASVTQPTEYARICLDRVPNIYWVLNMPGFWIWKDSEYARITKSSKYATIWLNMYEYIWIFNNRQGSEYVSCNT